MATFNLNGLGTPKGATPTIMRVRIENYSQE